MNFTEENWICIYIYVVDGCQLVIGMFFSNLFFTFLENDSRFFKYYLLINEA